MLEQEYEKLVTHIEDMISDGYQIMMGGRLIDWEDTKIPRLLKDIRKKKSRMMKQALKPGDLMANRVSGQTVAVINDDGKTVFLIASDSVMQYPSDKIWHHFKKAKKKKRKP